MRKSFVVLVLLTLGASAAADTLFGVYAGAARWQQDISGSVASTGSEVDIERDLGLDDSSSEIFYIAVEHPVPVLPNVRANYASVVMDGANVLNRTIQFNGDTYTVASNLRTDIDLTQADAVFYYEVLDNFVSLDLGLAARWLDGHVAIASAVEAGRAEFSGVLPMLYGRARMDLPFTGFWLGAEAQGLAYEGNQLIDANAQVGWESKLGFGAELGWRQYSLELDDYDEIDTAEIDVNGPYIGLNYHF